MGRLWATRRWKATTADCTVLCAARRSGLLRTDSRWPTVFQVQLRGSWQAVRRAMVASQVGATSRSMRARASSASAMRRRTAGSTCSARMSRKRGNVPVARRGSADGRVVAGSTAEAGPNRADSTRTVERMAERWARIIVGMMPGSSDQGKCWSSRGSCTPSRAVRPWRQTTVAPASAGTDGGLHSAAPWTVHRGAAVGRAPRSMRNATRPGRSSSGPTLRHGTAHTRITAAPPACRRAPPAGAMPHGTPAACGRRARHGRDPAAPPPRYDGCGR